MNSLIENYHEFNNSLYELESDAKKLGDEKLMKLIEECYNVDVKIVNYIEETYGLQ